MSFPCLLYTGPRCEAPNQPSQRTLHTHAACARHRPGNPQPRNKTKQNAQVATKPSALGGPTNLQQQQQPYRMPLYWFGNRGDAGAEAGTCFGVVGGLAPLIRYPHRRGVAGTFDSLPASPPSAPLPPSPTPPPAFQVMNLRPPPLICSCAGCSPPTPAPGPPFPPLLKSAAACSKLDRLLPDLNQNLRVERPAGVVALCSACCCCCCCGLMLLILLSETSLRYLCRCCLSV